MVSSEEATTVGVQHEGGGGGYVCDPDADRESGTTFGDERVVGGVAWDRRRADRLFRHDGYFDRNLVVVELKFESLFAGITEGLPGGAGKGSIPSSRSRFHASDQGRQIDNGKYQHSF